jgi:dsRNA-specific ribonuclease
MDNYFTSYCPKDFEGKGQSESIREAENEAAMQLLTALFNSNDELLPNFIKLKRQRNLK